MSRVRIDIPEDGVAAFCQCYGISRLSLFGSVLTDAFSPDSDVNVLVEFASESAVGAFDVAKMEAELFALFGRKADLRRATDLNRDFRRQVVIEAELLYPS